MHLINLCTLKHKQNIAQSLKNHGLKFIADVKDRKKSDAVNQSSVNETDIDVEAAAAAALQQQRLSTSQDHRKTQQQQNVEQNLLKTQYDASTRKSNGQINLDVNVPQVTISGPSSPFLYPTGRTGPGGEPIVLLSPGIPGTATPLTPGFATRPASAAGSAIEGDDEDDDDEFNLPGE